MRSFLVIGAVLIAVWAGPASADGPWDGSWFRDDAQSHYADHSFTFRRTADGKWQYTSGDETFVFATDGKPYPEMNAPDLSLRASASGERLLETAESAYGRDTARVRYLVATDGKSMSLTSTRVYPDGREVTSDSTVVRLSQGSGFEGTWKEHSEPVKPAASGTAAPAARPYWVIFTSADGVMTWFIPATGELIRGKPDGQPRPLTGPEQPGGRTFVWKQVSPRRIDFFASDNGHLVETAIETLSEDGATLTDTLWAAGHEDEKDVRVFRKR